MKPPSPTEAVILREIMDRGFVSLNGLIDAAYGHREDGGPETAGGCVRSRIYRLRTKLRPPFVIHMIGRRGWRLVTALEAAQYDRHWREIKRLAAKVPPMVPPSSTAEKAAVRAMLMSGKTLSDTARYFHRHIRTIERIRDGDCRRKTA